MKWRYAEINFELPGARFITKQYKDYSVDPYRKDWRVYEPLIKDEEWDVGETGCRYGKWREGK